jgi:ligand-binding SRPBCC domain-containing protein
MIRTFEAVQDLPRPREEVFAFFADPANLMAITPPWFHLEVLTPEPLPRGAGAEFEYRLRIRGLPLRWRTLIREYVPGERFVDVQLRGPYRLWEHTHAFEDLPGGGTRMRDTVRYDIGFGPFGALVGALWVDRDVRGIFEFRRRALAGRFG